MVDYTELENDSWYDAYKMNRRNFQTEKWILNESEIETPAPGLTIFNNASVQLYYISLATIIQIQASQ